MIHSIEELERGKAERRIANEAMKAKKKEKQINTLNEIAANSPQSRFAEDKKNILGAVTDLTESSRKNAMLNNMKEVYRNTDRTSRYQTGDMHENVTEPFKPMSDSEYKTFLLNAERKNLQREYSKNPYTIEYDEKTGRNVQRPTQAAYRIQEIDRELKENERTAAAEYLDYIKNQPNYEDRKRQNGNIFKNIGSAFSEGGRGIIRGLSGAASSISEGLNNAVYNEPYNFKKHIKTDLAVIQDITERKPELVPDIERYFALVNKNGITRNRSGFTMPSLSESAERKKIENRLYDELGKDIYGYITNMAEYRNPMFYLKDENALEAQKGGLANINLEQSGLNEKSREYQENKAYAPKAQQAVMSAAESIPLTAASAAASVVSPAAGLGLMGAASYGNSYAEAQQREYNPAKSAGAAAAKALIEVGTEALPLTEFSGAITSLAETGIKGAAKNIAKTMGSQLIEENIGEQLSLLGEKIVDQTAYGNGKWDTYLDEFVETANATTLSTLFFTGATLSTSSALGEIDASRQRKIAENVKAVEEKAESGELNARNIGQDPNYKEAVKETAAALYELKASGKTNEIKTAENTANTDGAVNDSSIENTSNKIAYLSSNENDVYAKTGNTHTRNMKNKLINDGEKLILTSKQETDDFINKSLNKENESEIRAFAKVNNRLVNDVSDMSDGKIDITDYYLELNSDDLWHAKNRHGKETTKGQISLTDEEIKNIPNYMVNYDDVLNIEQKKDGRKRIVLGKKINGHSIVITAISRGRQALTFKTAYILNTKKYNEIFGNKKRNAANRKTTASNNETMPNTSETVPFTALLDNNISQNEDVVNNPAKNNSAFLSQPMQNNTPVRIGRPISNTANRSEHFKHFESTFRADIARKTGVTINEPVFAELTGRELTREQRQVVFDAKNLGLDVTFFRQTNDILRELNEERNGAYLNGRIYLNEDTDAPYKTILGHELLHHLKKTSGESYNKILDIVRDAVNEQADFESLIDDRTQTHTESEKAEQTEEIIADVMGDILQNSKRYRQVLRQNMSVTQKILSFIRDMIDRFYKKPRIGYTADKSNLMGILKESEKELAAIMADGLKLRSDGNAVYDDNAKFSVRNDRNGRPYVEIEEDILKGVPKNEWRNKVREVLYTRKIQGNRGLTAINSVTRNEYLNSNYTRKISRDTDKEKAKFRMAKNIDEIVQSQDNIKSEVPKHQRRDSFERFERGKIRVLIKEKHFVADVITGIKRNGERVLYDVVGIDRVNIKEKGTVDSSEGYENKSRTFDERDNNVPKEGAYPINTYQKNSSDRVLRQYENQTAIRHQQPSKDNLSQNKDIVNRKNEKSSDIKYSRKNSGNNIYDYTKSFSEQLDDWKKGKIPEYDTLLVGETPEILRKIGFNALPVTINQTHIDYAINGSKDIDHTIGETLLKQLPQALKSPVAVIKSSGRKGSNTSLVVLLDMKYNNKTVIVPIVIDGYGRHNNITIDSNSVTSIYAKENLVSKFKDAVKDEINGNIGVYYINKNKANALLQTAGHQLSGDLFRNNGFIHSINEKGSKVNTKFKNVTQTQQFKRWFGDWQNNPKRASKVVNADGTPRVVYHGTDAEFNIFKQSNNAYYLSNSREYARIKAGHKNGGRVISAYLNMQKPYKVTINEHTIGKPIENTYIDYAKKNNYDGVIFDIKTNDGSTKYTLYAVFSPNQIKSASDNIGTFDANISDIKYSRKNSNLKAYEVVDSVDNSDKFIKIKREKNPKNGAMPKYKFDWERPRRKLLEDSEEYNKIIEKIKGKNDVYKIPAGYYTNDVYRIFRDFFGEDSAKMKELILDKFEDSKRAYEYIRDFYTNILYDKIVKELGIKRGSKLSMWVQLYGEYKNADGADKVTETTLRENGFSEDEIRRIKKADEIVRWMYDSLIETINDTFKVIYPNEEKKISDTESEIKNLHYEIGELKEAQATGDFSPLELEKLEKLEEKIANKEKKLEEYKKRLREHRVYKRADYYRHFREMDTSGFKALDNILRSSASISNELAAISEFTKPKTKFASYRMPRGNGEVTFDAVGGFLDYIKAASYTAAIDPNIDMFRKLAEDIGKTPISWSEDGKIQGEHNGIQRFLQDYANMLAGKTSMFDRAVQNLLDRKIFKALNWFASRIKSNMVLGNLGSSVAQILNVPNAIGYIGDPTALALGIKDSISGIVDKKFKE